MGSFRSKPDTVKHTTVKDGPGFSYAVSHMCGWRIYMEDAHLAVSLSDKKSFLFAVFDGHGGAEVSTFVARHFVQELEQNKNYKKRNYQSALKETFLRMDQLLVTPGGKTEVVSIQKEMREKQNGPNYQEETHAGCTANVCLITPEFVYVANAGDSRAVACIKGETKQLSHDHKPEDKQELDRIKKAGGEVSFGRVNGNLNLSRAIGDLQYKTNRNLPPEEQMITANPAITKTKNENIDFIIMGCDGIWEVKTNVQMVQWITSRLIKQKKELGRIAQELLDELIAKDSSGSEYGMDNMSAILIRFDKTKK